MSATATDTVTLTIDGRETTVPKGTPLVIAAAGSGVEIPVFCYEPRLGPAVGACRMCLVEIEGMPKLQAACTMVATDGMKVKTRSPKAADGQRAVLEFILLNHPLDCPVCDKGGECPLQDLTYRYGPGNTRYFLSKRTYEKPVPVSPLIALDRERCILCYRCTRFSQEVAEDEQLIARERGADSIIATFEERPYVGAFSGNVIELCPVGALTSTGYRFLARPWEINNIPTVCGLCPTGCNTWATVREGAVRRVLGRNEPEVDEGWLCDKGRFAYGHPHAADRYRRPLVRDPGGLDEVSWQAAAETVALRLRHYVNLHGPDSVAVVASGEQSNEEAYAWTRIVAAAGGGSLVGSDLAWEELDPYAAGIADLDHADLVVVAGDRDVVDAVGVVELRVRKAVRAGARLVLAGCGGSALDRAATERLSTAPGQVESVFDQLATRLAAAQRPLLLVTDAVPIAAVATLANAAGLHTKPGGVLPLPSAPNERGVRLAGFDADPDAVLDHALAGDLKMLVLLGDADPITHRPRGDAWREAIERADSVVVQTMFPNEATGWAHVILPATAALEKDGTFTNLEGRTQRLRPSQPPPDGIVAEIDLLAAAATHLGVDLPGGAGRLYEALAQARPAFADQDWDAVGRGDWQRPARPAVAPLGDRPSTGNGGGAGGAIAASVRPGTQDSGALRVVAYRPLFAGPAVARTPRLDFQRPEAILLNRGDAERLGISAGQQVTVHHRRGRTSGPARLSRTLDAGAVRIPWSGQRLEGECRVEAGG